jgi:hypothetical protein
MLINKKHTRILCVVFTLAPGIILGVWQTRPPRVNKSSQMYPVYERMMTNLQKMAEKPHKSNSAEIKVLKQFVSGCYPLCLTVTKLLYYKELVNPFVTVCA